MRRLFSRVELVAWVAAIAVAWAALAVTGYESRDPDSRLHAGIEADQLARPACAWIAPEWAGHWDLQGLYREHPVGTFVPPVLLAKAGFPARQAGYAVNAVYQVLGLLLVALLAARFVPLGEAHTLTWLLQLIPIAFTYRIRANHEPALLFFFLLALYSTERSRRRPTWCALTVASVVGMMLVKGLFAALVPLSCAAWLLASRAWSRRLLEGGGPRPVSADRWAWAGIGLSIAAALFGAAGYEWAYRQASGESFLAEYLHRQLGVAAAQSQSGAWMVLQKLRNLFFYAIRIAWFALPWSLVLLVAPWRRRGEPGARGAGRVGPEGEAARGALLGVLAIAALWVGVFSLSDRLADRFVFPVYYLVAAAGALLALRSMPAVERWVSRIERLGPAVVPAVWLAAFLLQLVSPRLGLPYVNR